MISKIHIQALKSIKDVTLECSRLNLFAGTNSSGKSTCLQALLLAAQNEYNNPGLNGKLISLGEFREVRNYYMANQPIKIELWEEGRKIPAWIKFEEDKEKESYGVYTSGQVEEASNVSAEAGWDDEKSMLPMQELGFHYLSCQRIGVNDIYKKNMEDDSDFGTDGEYALAYLLKKENDPVVDGLRINDDAVTNSLLDQVNYWMQYIVGTTLHISDLKKQIIYR